MTQVLLEKTTETEHAGEGQKPLRVCFVCTGNTCRSPMAEALANALAKEKGVAMEAFSAGLSAAEGEPIAKNAQLALEEAKVPEIHPYRLHLSHNLTEDEAAGYDSLVGVTRRHALELFFRFPALADKIAFLPNDVSDPFGGGIETYRACLAELRQNIMELFFPEGKA